MLVVHGVWTRARTLALWVEVPRRRPGAARAEDLARLASSAPGALRTATALAQPVARSLTLQLPCTPAGRPAASTGRPRGDLVLAPVALEVVELRGDAVLDVLEEVRGAAHDVAGDGLRWLAHVAHGARTALDAGSVVPDLERIGGPGPDGAVHARWVPLPDRRFHRWRSAVAEAAPPVLRAESGDRHDPPPEAAALLDEVCGLVCDLLAARRTAGVAAPERGEGPGSPAVRAWLSSLRTGAPLDLDAAAVASLTRRVREWQRSGDDSGYDLVLRVVEPEPWEDLDDGPAVPGATPDEQAAPADASWRLQARLRPVDEPSLTLTLAQVRAESGATRAGDGAEDPLLVLLSATARAGAVHPPLRRLLGGTGDAASERGVELGITDLLDLVEVGGPKLAAAGLTLQLPRRWTRRALSFSLTASAAQPGAITDPQLRKDDLVAFRWQAALGGAEVSEAELLALARSKSPLVAFRGEWVHVDLDALRRSAEFLRTRGSGRASIVDVLGAVGSAREIPGPVTSLDARGVLGDLLSGAGAERLPQLPDPPGLNATLRPYQRRGVTWLAAMSRLGLGAVLADDMGLGKTLQLLALLVHEVAEAAGTQGAGTPGAGTPGAGTPGAGTQVGVGPTLLVCPMSVVGNWQAEAARFAPRLRVHVQHGTARPRGSDLVETATAHDLVITTYGLLVRDVGDLAEVPWRRVALDEAQHVKNTATRAARAVRAIPAQHRVALTGTPVENRLEDLRAVLDVTNPGLLGSAASFRDTFAVPVEKLGHTEPARRLALVTRPFVLRRVKTDPAVAGDLPEKIEMTVRANLTLEQAALYQAVVTSMLERLEDAEGMERRGLVLATLTRLKQICNHPAHYLGDSSAVVHRGRHRSGKLQLLDDIVTSARAEGEKVLCFTQFTEFGRLLTPHLREVTGEPVPFLHGGVPRRRRDQMVAEFSETDGPGVMFLSLKAGGTGLNLTAANHVVHVDRWWNPAVEDQATDRAHRIGQTRSVQVRKLVSVGTVEERVDAMITRKRELAESVVGAGEGWISELDGDALRELVTLGADAVGE